MSTGAWVALWAVIVIAALAVFVLIGLYLFRKAKATLLQAQGTMDLFGKFADAMGTAESKPYTFTPGLGATPEQRENWRHQRRVNRVRRGQRKKVRRQVTLARWRRAPHEAIKG